MNSTSSLQRRSILQGADDKAQAFLSQQSRGAAAEVNRIDRMRQDFAGDAVRGKKALPAFQFTLRACGVLVENSAPLHARAEIAKAALGRAKRDLDVDAEG